MPKVCLSEHDFHFPSVEEADEEGLVLIGGGVTPDRVLEAYQKGIFPWYSQEELPLWWSPDPRFVLFPEELHVSRTMQKFMKKDVYSFGVDTDFEQVITACATTARKDQRGTWITGEMMKVYTELFYQGYAHSAEAWKDGELVGGLYGIRIGKIFFAESMFHTMINASKFALIKYVQLLQQQNVGLIDCQVYTHHVKTMGGTLIDRKVYLDFLEKLAFPPFT